MCELFGASLKRNSDITKYLKEFFSHSVKHPHGYGIMYNENGDIRHFKEPIKAVNSQKLKDILQNLTPQKNVLGHIRLATVGKIKQENCHPFYGKDIAGREWTFIHNGTIYSGSKLMNYLEKQAGDTDSERVFMYLLDLVNNEIRLNSNKDLGEHKRCEIVKKLAFNLSKRNKFNFMIFDGDLLFVHKNMKDTLYIKENKNGVIISTVALDKEHWEQIPMAKVLAYRNGEKVFESESHGNEFVPTLDYLNALATFNI